jgi:hypothetical protein
MEAYDGHSNRQTRSARLYPPAKKSWMHPTLSLGIYPFVGRSFHALEKIEEAE